jgi:hypothetical protein
MRFYILDYDIYRTDCEDQYKSGNVIAVKTGVAHTFADLFPLLSSEAIAVCISIGNTQMFHGLTYKAL